MSENLKMLWSVGLIGLVWLYVQRNGATHLMIAFNWLRGKAMTFARELYAIHVEVRRLKEMQKFRKDWDWIFRDRTWKSVRNITMLLLLMLVAVPAFATDKYFAASTVGGGTMADCAHALIWTDATNGRGTANAEAPGNTLHLCGTFTLSAGDQFWVFGHSGSAGNPITLKWEAGAIVQGPWLSTSGAIAATGFSYITIDGGTNGIIQCTANGSALANQQGTIMFWFTSGNHITVQNMNILTTYIHAEGVNDAGAGFSSQGINISQGDDSLITHNTITDVSIGIGVGVDSANMTNAEISFNSIINCNRCAVAATGSGHTFSNILVHDNDFGGGAQHWDEGTIYHHNAFHAFSDFTGPMTNIQVYNNYVHGQWGGAGGPASTSSFFFEQNDSTDPILLYNNVIIKNFNNKGFATNGEIFCKITGNACALYNNVIMGLNDGNHGGTGWECNTPQTMTFQNNILAYMSAFGGSGGAGMGCTWGIADYNDYYLIDNSFDAYTFADWKTMDTCNGVTGGCDAHSITTDPGLDASFVPDVADPVYHAGISLSSFGITALNTSKNSVARTGSNWTMGANDVPGSGGGGSPGSPIFIATMAMILFALFLPLAIGSENPKNQPASQKETMRVF